MPGRFNIIPNTGILLRKLIATGKKPLEKEHEKIKLKKTI
jgi:hypothetical protein